MPPTEEERAAIEAVRQARKAQESQGRVEKRVQNKAAFKAKAPEATKIQAAFRGFKGRKDAKEQKEVQTLSSAVKMFAQAEDIAREVDEKKKGSTKKEPTRISKKPQKIVNAELQSIYEASESDRNNVAVPKANKILGHGALDREKWDKFDRPKIEKEEKSSQKADKILGHGALDREKWDKFDRPKIEEKATQLKQQEEKPSFFERAAQSVKNLINKIKETYQSFTNKLKKQSTPQGEIKSGLAGRISEIGPTKDRLSQGLGQDRATNRLPQVTSNAAQIHPDPTPPVPPNSGIVKPKGIQRR